MLPLSSILLLAYCFLFPLLAFISTSEVENFAPPRNLKELQDSLNSLGIQAPVNALESPVLKAVTTFTLGQASCKSTVRFPSHASRLQKLILLHFSARFSNTYSLRSYFSPLLQSTSSNNRPTGLTSRQRPNLPVASSQGRLRR